MFRFCLTLMNRRDPDDGWSPSNGLSLSEKVARGDGALIVCVWRG
jgi:hypothetical protein